EPGEVVVVLPRRDLLGAVEGADVVELQLDAGLVLDLRQQRLEVLDLAAGEHGQRRRRAAAAAPGQAGQGGDGDRKECQATDQSVSSFELVSAGTAAAFSSASCTRSRCFCAVSSSVVSALTVCCIESSAFSL